MDVSPFTKSLGTIKKVQVIDCAIAHDCSFTGETHIIILYNALHIPEMLHNLVPPFVIRREGHTLSDVPKIQVADPSIDDHSLLFKNSDVRIPLQLVGITSYFSSRIPTADEVTKAVDIDSYFDLNTDEPIWNPHNVAFARNEETMLDFEGNMVLPEVRNRNLFEPGEVDDTIRVDSLSEEVNVSALELEVSATAVTIDDEIITNKQEDHIDAALHNISNTYDPRSFAQKLNERLAISKFGESIGINVGDPRYIMGSDDAINIGAVHAEKPKGVTPAMLSKVFRIDLATAKRTLQLNSQRLKRTNDPELSRRFPSNDRMLRYRRIKEFFFMDTFYATGKAGKTTRGNSCMQVFVTDKGFTWVCPMAKEADCHKALKKFFKVIGIPDAIVCDSAKAQIHGVQLKSAERQG